MYDVQETKILDGLGANTDNRRVSEEMLCELMNRCVGGFVLRRDHASERGSFPTRLAELLRAERVVISSYVPGVPASFIKDLRPTN